MANVWGLDAVFIGCAALALLWWLAMWKMPSPPPLSSEVVDLNDALPDTLDVLMERLAEVVGIKKMSCWCPKNIWSI